MGRDQIDKEEFEIQVKGINNITEMEGMFRNCYGIECLDLSNLDTTDVINMDCMFTDCTNLKEIKGMNNFNIKNVKTMECMFCDCINLEYLDFSNLNLSNV